MLTVSSCWSKLPANKTRSKAATLRELEAWESGRREKAAEIEARRRAERAAASLQRLPAGYGRNGAVPAYVEAHLVSLQASPLGKSTRPINSAIARSSPSSTERRDRHLRKTGWASDTTLGTRRQTSPISPGRRRRRVKGGAAFIATAIAATSTRPVKREQLTNSAESRQGIGQPRVQSMAAVRGSCSTTRMQKREHEGSAPPPPVVVVAFLVPSGSSSSADPHIIRNAVTTNNSSRVVIRPASAPSAPRRRSKRMSPGGSGWQGDDGPVPSPADTREAGLLEKLTSLTCLRPDGEYPTVAALRAAVAIETIQTQLRECRNKKAVGGSKVEAAGLPRRGVSATAVTGGVHRPAGEAATNAILRAVPRRRKEIEPWDNWSPFVLEKATTTTSTGGTTARTRRTDRPMSAPALRMLGSNDPVFGNADDAYRNGWRRRRSARSHSPDPPAKNATKNGDQNEQQTPNGRCTGSQTPPRGDKEACTMEASSTAAVAAAVRKVEDCSSRLTVGALIELSRLRNPPEPVRAVQAALACLLGWQQQQRKKKNKSSQDDPAPSSYFASRSLFSNNAYLLRGILNSVCPRRISGRRLSMLEKRLRLEVVGPARVKGANAAAAVLLEWLLAVVACARAEEAEQKRRADGELLLL